MEIVDFLAARLDEDEAATEAASGSEWGDIVPQQPFVVFDVEAYRKRKTQTTVGAVASVEHAEDRTHIARHDPARVLREVEAKRELVGRYERAMENRRAHPEDLATAGALLALHGAVKLLAAVYADHPDYREEWRP